MSVEGLEKLVSEHAFFAGLDARFLRRLTDCARSVRFEAETYLFHDSEAADEFYLLRQGHVALEIVAPGRGPLTFQTLGAGEIVGISWLLPPYRWAYDARALERTEAFGFDARSLRELCEADHDLGYELMKRVVPVVIQRLQATRLQILDVYGGTD